MPTIAKLLDTRSKKEQEQRVQQLIQAAQTPVISVMVLLDPRSGRVDIRAAGVDQPSVDDIKFVLRQAIDRLTAEAANQAMQNKRPEIVPGPELVPLDPAEDDPGGDED